jgi:hypothetical protein
MMMQRRIRANTGANTMPQIKGAVLAGMLTLPVMASAALADPVADFYKGKQIKFIVRTTPGGDYDQYSRLLARFMGKHIPGNPQFVVVNMPGGGGITAANYMAQVAPRDGTVIGIVSQGLAADQALAISPQLKADLREFNWLGNVVYSNQLLVVWHTSPPSAPPAPDQPPCSIRRSTTTCSVPSSRSCSAIRAASSSILRWSAARSKAAAPTPIRAGWHQSRPGFRRS